MISTFFYDVCSSLVLRSYPYDAVTFSTKVFSGYERSEKLIQVGVLF